MKKNTTAIIVPKVVVEHHEGHDYDIPKVETREGSYRVPTIMVETTRTVVRPRKRR